MTHKSQEDKDKAQAKGLARDLACANVCQSTYPKRTERSRLNLASLPHEAKRLWSRIRTTGLLRHDHASEAARQRGTCRSSCIVGVGATVQHSKPR